MVLLERRGDEVVDHRRLRQLAVLAGQGGGDVLGDHHPRVDSRLAHQERRQAADQRVDQAIQAPLGDPAQLGHGDRQQVGGHRHRFAVGIGLGYHPVGFRRTQQQRVVGGRVEFGLYLPRRVGQLVTAGAMDLRYRADAQGILGADAAGVLQYLAASQQGSQIGGDPLHPGMRLERNDLGVERRQLAAQGLEAHRPDHVGPLRQALRVVQGQAGEAGHARRAVDQAEPVLGSQAHRRQAFRRQRGGGRHDAAAVADLADAEQGDADVRHVGQVAHRALGRHLRGNAVVEQRQQSFHQRTVEPGLALAVVGDGGTDDRPGLFVAQRLADPAGMAEQGVARQLGELLAFQQDVAQRAEAGTDAVGTLAVGDDTADDGAGVVDPCPGRRRQFQARTVPGHRDQFLPTQRAVAEHDAR